MFFEFYLRYYYINLKYNSYNNFQLHLTLEHRSTLYLTIFPFHEASHHFLKTNLLFILQIFINDYIYKKILYQILKSDTELFSGHIKLFAMFIKLFTINND